jgi:hypothetical protein
VRGGVPVWEGKIELDIAIASKGFTGKPSGTVEIENKHILTIILILLKLKNIFMYSIYLNFKVFYRKK